MNNFLQYVYVMLFSNNCTILRRNENEDFMISNECLKQAIEGDVKAFNLLVEKSYMMIYAIAYKWTANKEDAEDIAQEVCLKLGHSIQNFRMDAQLSTWLYRITLNKVRDYQRKKQRHTFAHNILEIKEETSSSPHIQVENQELWTYVQKLPEKQKNAIFLIYMEGLTHIEASKVMDCKESTVSWYIHEAKKQLKLMVNDDEKI